jgi:pantoate--beta-alanine ligase
VCKGKVFYWKTGLDTLLNGRKTLEMILFKDPELLSSYLDALRNEHIQIGFVPTMGALHAGHISLLEQSGQHTSLTVCSIFINPTQFNDKEDFDKYPVSLEDDINKIESAGMDILFLPDASSLYQNGTGNLERYDIGYLETVLEGKFRPGHFQGVCQVMSRLLKIIRPHKLFMGQKDYQQSLVVEQLLHTLDLQTAMVVSPTFREENGLAMSSRNMRLSDAERKEAGNIYETLLFIKKNLKPGELGTLVKEAKALLNGDGFKVDYIEIADAKSLQIVDTWNGEQKLVALVAVFIRDVRLIDNMVVNGDGSNT